MERGDVLQQIPGGPWVLIKERVLGRGAVYRSEDAVSILRIGPRQMTISEGKQTAWLHREGFLVPHVLHIGQIGDLGYWVETSLGGESLGERFRTQYLETQCVEDTDVDIFQGIIVKWLDAQLRLGKHFPKRDELYAGLNIANVLEENPDLPLSLVRSSLRRARKELASYPLAPSHGDANAFNMLDHGIIDLEHLFWGPAGYDSVNAIDFTEFFALETPVKKHLAYRFSDEQRRRCFEALDEVALGHALPPVSDHFSDFLVLKVLWSLSYMKELIPARPDGEYLWHWRRGVAQHALEQYLSHEEINPRTFARIEPLRLHAHNAHDPGLKSIQP
ncbi:MAG: hypothetical protein ACP5OR_00400 [Candidatus Dormibacteria bacterium]